ncbi:MAG: Abi family protein [gamma proteobacterium symbiont of Taylorina sp.]|nr:Abi family protein [gamma proteobacterium symbiont of Taylorina sp.]
MNVQDEEEAEYYLSHLNYSRLGAYWLPFEVDHSNHKFKSGVTFKDVLDLYIFDRELRLLVLDAIERIEVSIRTQWAYHMAHKHGAHSHLNANLSVNNNWHERNLASLKKELTRSDEVFVHHYNNTYTNPAKIPPVWSVCEVMSLGLLSRWYKSLNPAQTRTAIARTYNLPVNVLTSFVEHLAYIRNICAHHSRLWNRRMTKTMQIPRSNHLSKLITNFNLDAGSQRKLYNTLVMLAYLMDIICMEHHFRPRLKELLLKHNIDTRMMGFPTDWEQLPIWKE